MSTWGKQYRASETHQINAMESLLSWLEKNVPPINTQKTGMTIAFSVIKYYRADTQRVSGKTFFALFLSFSKLPITTTIQSHDQDIIILAQTVLSKTQQAACCIVFAPKSKCSVYVNIFCRWSFFFYTFSAQLSFSVKVELVNLCEYGKFGDMNWNIFDHL